MTKTHQGGVLNVKSSIGRKLKLEFPRSTLCLMVFQHCMTRVNMTNIVIPSLYPYKVYENILYSKSYSTLEYNMIKTEMNNWLLLLKRRCADNRPSIPLWADATKHRRWGSSQLRPRRSRNEKFCSNRRVGGMWEIVKGSSGIQSMTWVHGKLINTANPLDLFQLTVPVRTMWDMQLTKASGWLTPHPLVSLPASLGSESNSTADICALTIWGLGVWCITGFSFSLL